MNRKIYVTKASLPPFEDFNSSLKEIWQSRILTNNGPFHEEFEKELAHYLGVKYLSLFSNGTLALLTALKALNISGEVITTPFSFVATTHSIWWNNLKPVFVDIDPVHFNLNPDKIEAAISPLTRAILPVHVFGNPCQFDKISKIAEKYDLKIIYDAAHAFGVKINEHSILEYGDLSILSFHATKVFNTIEGGAVVCHDENMKQKIDLLRNFGFKDEITVIMPGINAKMNEIQSAYGLIQLKYVDKYIKEREKIVNLYKYNLKGVEGLRYIHEIEGVQPSYSYFPILIKEEEYGHSRDDVYEYLKSKNIYGRRYFYPLISQFPPYNSLISANPNNLSVALKISREVICLPIYPDLEEEVINQICEYIISFK